MNVVHFGRFQIIEIHGFSGAGIHETHLIDPVPVGFRNGPLVLFRKIVVQHFRLVTVGAFFIPGPHFTGCRCILPDPVQTDPVDVKPGLVCEDRRIRIPIGSCHMKREGIAFCENRRRCFRRLRCRCIRLGRFRRRCIRCGRFRRWCIRCGRFRRWCIRCGRFRCRCIRCRRFRRRRIRCGRFRCRRIRCSRFRCRRIRCRRLRRRCIRCRRLRLRRLLCSRFRCRCIRRGRFRRRCVCRGRFRRRCVCRSRFRRWCVCRGRFRCWRVCRSRFRFFCFSSCRFRNSCIRSCRLRRRGFCCRWLCCLFVFFRFRFRRIRSSCLCHLILHLFRFRFFCLCPGRFRSLLSCCRRSCLFFHLTPGHGRIGLPLYITGVRGLRLRVITGIQVDPCPDAGRQDQNGSDDPGCLFPSPGGPFFINWRRKDHRRLLSPGILLFGESRLHLVHRLETVSSQHCYALHQCGFLLRRDHCSYGRRQRDMILYDPVYRFLHLPACDHPVHGSAQRIDIRPGPLFSVHPVLFLRCIARFQNDRKASRSAGGSIPRRSEIQKLHFAFIGDKNIIRRNVPVNDPFPVHLGQCIHHRSKNRHGFIRRVPFSFFQDLLDRLSFQVFHDDIPGPVLLETVKDLYDSFYISKTGQPLGFFHKAFQPGVKICLGAAGINRDLFISVSPGRHRAWEVFFDGDHSSQNIVPADIGDPESSGADHFANDIPVLDHRPRRKIIGFPGLVILPVPTVWTDFRIIIDFCHTAHTTFHETLLHCTLIVNWNPSADALPDILSHLP